MQVMPVGSSEGTTSQTSAPTTCRPVIERSIICTSRIESPPARDTGARRFFRIEPIDIDGNVSGPAAEHAPDLFDNGVAAK